MLIVEQNIRVTIMRTVFPTLLCTTLFLNSVRGSNYGLESGCRYALNPLSFDSNQKPEFFEPAATLPSQLFVGLVIQKVAGSPSVSLPLVPVLGMIESGIPKTCFQDWHSPMLSLHERGSK